MEELRIVPEGSASVVSLVSGKHRVNMYYIFIQISIACTLCITYSYYCTLQISIACTLCITQCKVHTHTPFKLEVTGLKQEMVGWGLSAKLQRTSYSVSMQSPLCDRSCWSSLSYLQRRGGGE